MKLIHKTLSVFLCAIILISGMGITGSFISAYADSPTHTGTVKEVSPYLNVRSAPTTGNNYIGKLYSGDSVVIYGDPVSGSGIEWYKIAYSSGYGYVGASYIINIEEIPSYDYNQDFEAHLTEQGFPESYKVLLRELHATHPEWIFLADHTAMSWADAVKGESVLGKSLVQHNVSSIPDSWKSMAEGAYSWDSDNPSYISFDSGYWVAAEQEVIEYYLEPRNFLNENSVYMFLDQAYNPAIQNKEGLQNILNGTFMEGAFPEDTYATYADVIMEAAKQSGVSPYVIAATILVEQGVRGQGGCISGTVKGFKGYYNFFNINAYARNGRSAVVNGLRYASDIDNMKTYDRPWNSRAKSIIGGAKWYAAGYVNRGQNTLYYKKFNVIKADANGNYYNNQYMTNVQAAYSESSKLKSAYSGVSAALTFSIPVYKDMPESNTTALPTSTGANNYFITALYADGKEVQNFSMFQNNCGLVLSETATEVSITADVPEGAAVSGTGTVSLSDGNDTITLTVTAASGKKADYILTVLRHGDAIAPTDYTGIYDINGALFYVKNGCIDYYYNSLCEYEGEWYYIEDGTVNWTAKTLTKYGDTLFFVQNGKVDWDADTLFLHDGVWYYVKYGQVAKTGKTLAKWNGSWFYIENGQINWRGKHLVDYGGTLFYVEYGKVVWDVNTLFMHDGVWYHVKNGQVAKTGETLCKFNGSWFYIKDGKVNWSDTTLVHYVDTLFYVKGGKIDWDANTLIMHDGIWYHVKYGQVAKTGKTLCKFNGSWFYIENGKVNWSDTTLVKYGDTLFYVRDGKIDWNTNTLFKYDGIWYHVKNGQVAKTGETLVKYNGAWFYIQNGKINWSAKKLVKYGDTLFYVQDGQINWRYNGKATYNGKTYTVKGGQVKY